VAAVLLLLGLSAACGTDDDPPGAAAAPAPAAPSSTAPASAGGVARGPVSFTQPQQVATGLEAPWGVAFLPGGDALVSERDTARILRLPAGGGRPQQVAEVKGVRSDGEGGLLGLAVAPSFDQDGLVYAYYTAERDNRVVRFPLDDPADVEVLVDGIDRSSIHNGGRIAFGPDGMLYASTGDASDRGESQDPDDLNGKILRMTPDGSVPADNPTAGSLVWSLGHRNVQGLAWDADGRMYASEFGQNTFDELNLIEPGNNYGWPEVEGRGDTRGGRFTDPLLTWDPAEASPSGIAVVGDELYVAALRGRRVWDVPLDGRGGVGAPVARLEGELGRVRTVAAAPDGGLWVLTSNRDGRGSPREGDDRVLHFGAA